MVDGETRREVVRPAVLWVDPLRKKVRYYLLPPRNVVGPGPSFIRWGQCVEFTPDGRFAQFAYRVVSRPNPLWSRTSSEIAEGYGDGWNKAVVKEFDGRRGTAELEVNGSPISFSAWDIVKRDYGDRPSLSVGSLVFIKLKNSGPGSKPLASLVIDLEELTPSE